MVGICVSGSGFATGTCMVGVGTRSLDCNWSVDNGVVWTVEPG